MEALAEISFLGGLIAGLASSLHCAGMCGGIASGLMFSLSPSTDTGTRTGVLMAAQTGRVLAYVIAGGAVGFAGTALYAQMDFSAAQAVFRWGAAMMLVWIGFSLTGWLPGIARLDRALAPVTRLVMRPALVIGPASPLLAGLAWGALPCAMVYAALLYAMLSGSALSGALVMLGFGVGTLASVTVTALGINWLERSGRKARFRLVSGFVIALLGLAMLAVPPEVIAALCRVPG
ncbi:sulfite exporter TauE/SafE family protein [Hyphobacterium sp.]|uniref:sulfite exporter TauE/SafE family protein n=1 Tax=Hyphobacterium sp. TaxID=2004662 RepID=UPI003B518AF7